jgi:signal transduction histidine kinase/putative methionine-R-sulfoxide reductase with GAF domain
MSTVSVGHRMQWAAGLADLEKLRQAAVEINGQPDLQSTLDATARWAANLLGVQGATVYLHDAERDELEVRGVYNMPASHLGRRLKVGDGLSGRVFLMHQPQLVGDYLSWDQASPVWRDVTFGTVLAVPLRYSDNAIGVLNFLDHAKNRVLDDDAMRVAGLFASLAAAALTSALSLADSRRRADRLMALQRVTATVSAVLDLPTVLQSVVEELRSTFGYALTSIHRLDGATLLLEAIAGLERHVVPDVVTSLDRGIIGRAARTARPQYVTDVSSDPDFVFVLPGTVAEAAVPVLLNDEVWGVLNVESTDRTTLSAADVPLLGMFCQQIAVALENVRLLVAERRERQRAETLGKVASILSSTLSLDDALRQVMQQLRSIVPYDNGALYLLQDGVMVCQVAEGKQAERWMDIKLSVGGYPLLQEMRTTLQTILVPDTRSDPRWVDSSSVAHLASWIGAPLVAEGQLMGMLSVDKAHNGYYTRENQEVTTAFANQVTVAIQRAQHFNDAQQRLRELSSLVQVSASLTEAPDLTAVLDVVLDSACDLLGCNGGAIALVEQQSMRLNVVAARGQPASFVKRMNEAMPYLPADLAREPALRSPVLIDPDAEPAQPNSLVICAALTVAGQVIGLIQVGQSTLDEAQRRLLTAVADLAAAAIDKAQLYQDTVRAYDELRELDRLKDEFVQNVSHELRTPLTFVRGYVEYLLEGYAGDLNQEQRQALEIVLNRSDAIVRLVNDIVSLKQAELQEMDLQPVALEQIALACVEGSKVAGEKAGIRIQIDFPSGLPPVYGDAKRLGQVFDNLLGNAIKFSPHGGVISVRLSQVSNAVQVVVRDTGIGMPSDRLEHIWKRFYQIDGASTRRFAGAGLGLAIVKRIIDAHHGNIWVESELGKGSTFCFTVPVFYDLHQA